MKARILLILGILFPLLLFGARKEKAAWEKAWQEGMDLYKLGRYAEAAPRFETVVMLLPNRSSGYAMLGKCRFNLADYAAALDYFQTAHRLTPEDGDSVYRLVTAHLALKQYPQVLEIVRGFDAKGIPAETRADYLRAAGLAAFALRDYRGAAAFFQQGRGAPAGDGRPADLQAWLVKALIQGAREGAGEARSAAYAQALPEAEALAAADPSGESHRLAAESALGCGNFSAAESHARALIKLEPGDPFGALYLGQALCGLERFRDAVDPLERAGALLPGEGRKAAWNQLGYAWERLGEHAKALESYTRAGNEEKVRKLSEPAVP